MPYVKNPKKMVFTKLITFLRFYIKIISVEHRLYYSKILRKNAVFQLRPQPE